MASINDPFGDVDFSGLPPLTPYTARDGARLVFRAYASRTDPAKGSVVLIHSRTDPAKGSVVLIHSRTDPAKGSVVLIHGSSARSNSLHPLALRFAQAGYSTYTLDIRGHGESGTKGQIAYIGQLEDDLEDFLRAAEPPGERLLVGFSAGGGFALRFAASDRQNMFDRYLLLAPFLHQDAPTSRPTAGDWVATGIPRIIGLTFLNRLGLTQLNSLPVLAFALGAEARQFLTPTYSYALAMNFRPHNNYRADIVAAERPLQVLVGEDDELFYAEQFSAVFQAAGKPATVQTLPGVDHIVNAQAGGDSGRYRGSGTVLTAAQGSVSDALSSNRGTLALA